MVIDKQSEILKILLANKGQIRTIKIRRRLKTKKDYKHVEVYKETTLQARCGIKNDNRASVIEGRENGTLPARNSGLKGKEWEIYPYLLRTKEGELLFRFYKVHSVMNTAPNFYLYEKKVDKDEISSFTYASELKGNPSDVFEININNIIEVK